MERAPLERKPTSASKPQSPIFPQQSWIQEPISILPTVSVNNNVIDMLPSTNNSEQEEPITVENISKIKDYKYPSNGVYYFNLMGEVKFYQESKTEFKVFIQTTAQTFDPNTHKNYWKQVPMPNIIKERTQTKENTTGIAYQELDVIIATRTALFNQTKNSGNLQLYTDFGDIIPKEEAKKIPDLNPTLVKAVCVQESNNGITSIDVMTANNKKDTDVYKTTYGLTKEETMNFNRSIYFGIRFLATKGFKRGITYDEKTGKQT
jgi:hypothetical protein